MLPRRLRAWIGIATATLAGAADFSSAEIFVWIDQAGLTHISDDPSGVPEGAETGRDALRDLWSDATGEAVSGVRPDRASSRIERLIQGAVADLQSGETARATVALDARTGKVAWNFQSVHHDVWDYDTPSPPTLFQIDGVGEGVAGVLQTTKMAPE